MSFFSNCIQHVSLLVPVSLSPAIYFSCYLVSFAIYRSSYSSYSIQFSCYFVSFAIFRISFSNYCIYFSCYLVSFAIYRSSYSSYSIYFSCYFVSFAIYRISFSSYSIYFSCYFVSFAVYRISFSSFSIYFYCYYVSFAIYRIYLFYLCTVFFSGALKYSGSMSHAQRHCSHKPSPFVTYVCLGVSVCLLVMYRYAISQRVWWHAATLFIYFYIYRADTQYLYILLVEYYSCMLFLSACLSVRL
jgi:hypothetical protein